MINKKEQPIYHHVYYYENNSKPYTIDDIASIMGVNTEIVKKQGIEFTCHYLIAC